MNKITIGDRIRELREAQGLTQYKLAQITRINRSTIKRYEENYIKKISFDNLLKIANALDADVTYFLYRN